MSEWDNQQGMTNFWQNETQARSNELSEKAKQAHDAAMGRIDADKRAQMAETQLAEASTGYQSEVDYFVDLGEKMLRKLNHVEANLAKAQADNQNYQALLARPFAEISAHSPEFAASYHANKEMLASWMIAQKAYREVAMEMGAQLGKSLEEVRELGQQARLQVLASETKHGNNASDEPFLAPHIQAILARLT